MAGDNQLGFLAKWGVCCEFIGAFAMPVISWLLQPIMGAAAFIATWFVAEDSANFGVVQMAAAVLLITTFVAIATFWRSIVSWISARGR
jgi:hypothetical protein